MTGEIYRLRIENHHLKSCLEGIIADAENWNDTEERRELAEQILIRWQLMAAEGLRAARELDPIEGS